MGETVIEKIIHHNTGKKVKPGDIATVSVDRVMIHDIFIPFVAEKDPREGFGDDTLDSQCFDDLRRLLSGGTAAEILSGNDDIAFPDLSGQLRPKGAEAVLFHIINGLECQVLCGDDDIRIDIVPQDPDPSCK